MAVFRSFFFNTFFSLFTLLFFHLGCFFISTTNERTSSKKRKVTPDSHSISSTYHTKLHKPLISSTSTSSSSWSYFKKIFTFKSKKSDKHSHTTTPTQSQTLTTSPTLDSTRSLVSVPTPADTRTSTPSRKRRNLSMSDISMDHQSFPLRNDIFPCPTCGEIFHKTQLLENHQSVKHAVSELYDGDSGKNIVKIIFKTSWNDKEMKNPVIHRILKIHNSAKILAKFEEYREFVKSKAVNARRREERCIADGNELLRFHCSTFICNLGQNGNSSLCSLQYCSVCGIIRSGFSGKIDGISTMSSSWKAHVAIPEDLEEEFAFMNVKRAMLVCRVVAGRIGSDQELVDTDESSLDSVVGRAHGGTQFRSEEDELLVFNPRAVLPCFAIVYSV
ncbi:hypothetical protein IFM89_031476 [Coptis chinensis]|uniref:C2H2-type domain-containing protein n=1 Tax=Coptis chinensis TaxID=261450 RepID=A0A835LKC9_9MAGN|nr:hypothetical protein IFM89_031476 [Coptis chinensis]